MTRKSLRKKESPSQHAEPGTLLFQVEPYLESLRARHYSSLTVEVRQRILCYFVRWSHERGVTAPEEVSRAILERYQRHLFHTLCRKGKPVAARTQLAYLLPLKGFFKWMTRNHIIPANPAADLEMPRVPHRLPRQVLTALEAEEILSMPDLTTFVGLRDRAILETFYSTGVRRRELIFLKLSDLDLKNGVLFVDQGKGKKDRYIPIGKRALLWIEKYLEEVRPRFAVEPDPLYLFLTPFGEFINPNHMTAIMADYIKGSSVGKVGSCHLFRHTMATLMLEGGSDLRYVQLMLGHSRLETTEVYTHVAIHKLKAVHEATHPAKMKTKESCPPPPPAGAAPQPFAFGAMPPIRPEREKAGLGVGSSPGVSPVT